MCACKYVLGAALHIQSLITTSNIEKIKKCRLQLLAEPPTGGISTACNQCMFTHNATQHRYDIIVRIQVCVYVLIIYTYVYILMYVRMHAFKLKP
jgi:hypothetical protein